MSDSHRSRLYRGRFAPSPTGPLHFGSLVAAVGSYVRAKSQNGEWLVRIEDLDPPREMAGAADDILRTLEAFGFHWDGEVRYQSRRHPFYLAALEKLERENRIYPCACTRKEIADSSIDGVEGPVYPGTCRSGIAPGRTARAWRVRVESESIEFVDAVQGKHVRNLAADFGDFVVRRADGLFAYQLAVVVDDAEQGVTEVVRGADLIESTPRQAWLQRLLSLPNLNYVHLPVVLNTSGEKLSKQTFAPSLDRKRPLPALKQALEFLGQRVPPESLEGGTEDFWRAAVARWDTTRIPRRAGIIVEATIE